MRRSDDKMVSKATAMLCRARVRHTELTSQLKNTVVTQSVIGYSYILLSVFSEADAICRRDYIQLFTAVILDPEALKKFLSYC